MSAKRSRAVMTREHLLVMRGVLMWLEQQPEPNRLEIDVLTEIIERVESAARVGAIVRVRAKNLGTTPSERRRRVWRDGRAEMTDGELDALRRYYAEGLTYAAIGERLGRSVSTIDHAVRRLSLTRDKPVGHHARAPLRTPLQRARGVLAERRRREAGALMSG